MWTRTLKLALAGLLGMAVAVPALTQTPNPLAPVSIDKGKADTTVALPATPGYPELVKSDVDAWLDGYMPYALARGDVAGAVVVVVKDGQVLTQRGFGYADVAAQKPVDPANTMFRPGSISKLFTWTAVMQLVEAGKIDLDADVNQYLDFQISPYHGKPVTMRQIMTHTAGFEEIIKNILVFDPNKLKPLGDIVKERVPERIHAPGTTPAYSNYATAVAGYVVERVSGMSFDDYIERNIFERLDMRHATFRQPLPRNLAPFMSKGYVLGSGKAERYELIGMAPAGALAASGPAMAKFMIAHLNDGGPLLKPETARKMYASQHNSVPGINQMALGFYEQWINGRRAIAHGGDTNYFHSDLWLFPAENVGVFISMNSGGKEGSAGAIRSALFDQFGDRYLPSEDQQPPRELATAKEHAKMLVGTWTNSRRIDSSFVSALDLVGNFKIGLDDDDRPLLEAIPSLGGAPRTWIEIAPFIWQDANGHERLAAQVVDGKVVRWTFSTVSPFMVWTRTPWYLDGAWLIPAVLFGIAVILLTALSWPVGAIVRRRYGAALALAGPERSLHRLVRGFSWAVLLVLIGWTAVVLAIEDFELHSSLNMPIYLLQIVGTLAFVGLLAISGWNAWLAWTGKRGWFARLWSVFLMLAAMVVLWLALGVKLISLGTNF